jgi:glutamate/tyrosine decarboxylase-like PLP-dependent enzyme
VSVPRGQLEPLLARVARLTAQERAELDERFVGSTATVDELRAAFGGPLPAHPTDPATIVEDLVAGARPGIVASTGPRYFGFVIGGSTPAALAADWLVSGWDNNAGLFACAPAPSVIEETAARWLVELFRLPVETTVGFTTGATMASFSGLAAARHRVLARHGHDVETDGLQAAPPVRVLVGEERHVTIDVALRYLGFGVANLEVIPADEQGRMRSDLAVAALARSDGPTIVCTQSGNVNSGAFDDLATICGAAVERGAWVHVDGAFGLWAAITDDRRDLVAGYDLADSWTTDAHKWLNVPYDCGIAMCRDADAHRAALASQASYLVQGGAGAPYDPFDYVPEFSRRARGVPVYAALREFGRDGLAAMVSRACACARRFAERLAELPEVEILNDVVLNQVLWRIGDSDDATRRVIDAVQRDGTCWLSGTVWHGGAAVRISVSNWQTTFDDVDRSVAAIRRCIEEVAA